MENTRRLGITISAETLATPGQGGSGAISTQTGTGNTAGSGLVVGYNSEQRLKQNFIDITIMLISPSC